MNSRIQKKHTAIFAFIVIFAGIGTYLLINSFAATTTDTICPNLAAGDCRPYDNQSPFNQPIPAYDSVTGKAVSDGTTQVWDKAKSTSYASQLGTIGKPLTSNFDASTGGCTPGIYEINDQSSVSPNDVYDQQKLPILTSNVHQTDYKFRTYNTAFAPNDGGGVVSSSTNGNYLSTAVGVPVTSNVQADDCDGQTVFWNPITGDEWGFWFFDPASKSGSNPTTFVSANGHKTKTSAGFMGRFGDGGGRGAGTTYFSGLVRKWEIKQQKIEHALSFAFDSPAPSFVYPAGKSDGDGGTTIPEGTRFQLDPTLTDSDLAGLGCTKACLTIAHALQQYGMYAIDNSGSSKIYLEAESSAHWSDSDNDGANDTKNADVAQVASLATNLPKSLTPSNNWDKFRVVAPPCAATSTSNCPTTQSNTTASETANLWVNTTSGGSPSRCATPCAYDATKAYGSLNAAYQAARGGDTIRIIAGTYGSQTITNSTTVNSDAQPVSVLKSGNGQVSFTGEVKILANYLTLDGLSSTAPYDFKNDNYVLQIGESGNEGIHDVTINNFDGRNFWIKAAHHISINGGDWGPSIACRAGTYPGAQLENQITGTSGMASTPHDIKLDGLLIHDQNTDNATSCHTGGLIFQGGYNIVIKNSKFRQNAIYDILFDDFTGTFRTDGITIENNWFGPPVEPYSTDPSGSTVSPAQADIQVKWNGVPAKDWLVRYNSFGSGLALAWGGSPPSWTNVRIIGNTGGSIWRGTSWDTCAGFNSGVLVKYNAFVGIDNLGSSGASTPTCGDNSNISLGKVSNYGLSSTFPYTSTSNTNIDFHLKTTTAAKDLVTPNTGDYAISTDIDGDTRPKGSSNDSGADEAISSSSTKPGDTNGDNLVNIVDLSTVLSKWNTNFTSADFNKDNTVNVFDLSILLTNYGK